MKQDNMGKYKNKAEFIQEFKKLEIKIDHEILNLFMEYLDIMEISIKTPNDYNMLIGWQHKVIVYLNNQKDFIERIMEKLSDNNEFLESYFLLKGLYWKVQETHCIISCCEKTLLKIQNYFQTEYREKPKIKRQIDSDIKFIRTRINKKI